MLTRRGMFLEIKSVLAGNDFERTTAEEAIAFVEHQIELLDKKSTAPRSNKPTKNQVANESLKDLIVKELTEKGVPMTISELMATESLNGLSNQKINALLTQLRETDRISRYYKKKTKAYFALYNSLTEEEMKEQDFTDSLSH